MSEGGAFFLRDGWLVEPIDSVERTGCVAEWPLALLGVSE
jgi:hypothetical protein